MCCEKRYGCIIPIIISLIVAIAVGIIGIILSLIAVTGIIPLLYIIIGLATFFLIVLITVIIYGKKTECICKYGKCLTIGALGAIISAAVALALTVIPVIATIIFAVVTFFIILAIIEFYQLVICLIKANCCRD